MPEAIYTIGHSNRPWMNFVALLRENTITMLVDVRATPQSRFNPHFNAQHLLIGLGKVSIAYHSLPELGGKRAPSPRSPNSFFRREGGLQAYADYMATLEFKAALDNFLTLAAGQRAAIMCAEAKPEHCHRQLISDALLLRGIPVVHIIAPKETRPHVMHPAAKPIDGHIIYPAQQAQLNL